jgi:hypothetical protein
VLDSVGDVHLGAIDAGRLERLVQHPAGRSDEGLALAIFAVAGLFADEHHSRLFGPFTEDRLGSSLVEVAGPTAGGGLAQTV